MDKFISIKKQALEEESHSTCESYQYILAYWYDLFAILIHIVEFSIYSCLWHITWVFRMFSTMNVLGDPVVSFCQMFATTTHTPVADNQNPHHTHCLLCCVDSSFEALQLTTDFATPSLSGSTPVAGFQFRLQLCVYIYKAQLKLIWLLLAGFWWRQRQLAYLCWLPSARALWRSHLSTDNRFRDTVIV